MRSTVALQTPVQVVALEQVVRVAAQLVCRSICPGSFAEEKSAVAGFPVTPAEIGPVAAVTNLRVPDLVVWILVLVALVAIELGFGSGGIAVAVVQTVREIFQ